jgi:hypothetical protein
LSYASSGAPVVNDTPGDWTVDGFVKINSAQIRRQSLILKARRLVASMDANAVHAVEGWKFKPAEKDGQPVAVVIAVEIDFRRYRGN